ncbi:hypothetical protein [Polynucleobacter sp. AP-Feld-500C-C5]|uniref:hypothetical protein n=1 Tax=Polynucleobacter sp. AP-Feld-500C-C5 TaxID=2576924 RepID=UPI001C0ABC8A|nr:hypothetical protein [Polynucleobacter sp. AP-Feld-500C-C5]MBU3632878.1 hypothetical protein [Polynucleobacter sp. AP-Feld-500C-C5]
MKILSYSIFGRELIYQKGLLANIEIAKNLLPEWIVRVYCADYLPKEFQEKLRSSINVDLVILKEEYPYQGILWRMLPMMEGHDAVIIRDCDTRIFARDISLINDWMTSGFKYHICRDNPGSRHVILGGLWGARNANLQITKLWDRWRKKQGLSKFLWDIGFLKEHIYPRIRNQVLIYTEHVVYEGERNIRRIPGERGIYNNKLICLGMYAEEDISDEDDALGHEFHNSRIGMSYNDSRKLLISEDNGAIDNRLLVLVPRFKYVNNIINNIFIFNYLLIGVLGRDNAITAWTKGFILYRISSALRIFKIKSSFKYPDNLFL